MTLSESVSANQTIRAALVCVQGEKGVGRLPAGLRRFLHHVTDAPLSSSESQEWVEIDREYGNVAFFPILVQQSMHIHAARSIRCWPGPCFQIHNQQLLRKPYMVPADPRFFLHVSFLLLTVHMEPSAVSVNT